MIDIQETTADERGLIADAVCPIMLNVENALGELEDIHDDYFMLAEQKPIEARDAERIGRIIRISTNLLYDACAAFGLLTGFDSWTGTKYALEQVAKISRTRRVDSLFDKLSKQERYMSEEKRNSVCVARGMAMDLPDEQAEAVLLGLLKEAQA